MFYVQNRKLERVGEKATGEKNGNFENSAKETKEKKKEEREKRITWKNNTPAKKDGTSMLLQMIEEKIHRVLRNKLD